MSPANPGDGTSVAVAFSTGTEGGSSSIDLVQALAAALVARKHPVTVRDGWLAMKNGLAFVPRFVSAEVDADLRYQTTSTIQVSHPALVPDGVFEYQHSCGENLTASFVAGFNGFADVDLPALLEALASEPKECSFIDMTFPISGAPGQQLSRRAVLGPPVRTVARAVEVGSEVDHCFCPCCLLTKSHAAFKELLASDQFLGIRLLVMRNPDGTIESDCRVNGEDFEPGEKALVQYGATWPGKGFELRKQYVCVQTLRRLPGGP